jgi:hypothetical protein
MERLNPGKVNRIALQFRAISTIFQAETSRKPVCLRHLTVEMIEGMIGKGYPNTLFRGEGCRRIGVLAH